LFKRIGTTHCQKCECTRPQNAQASHPFIL
jgi:hypothetical protein